MDIFTARSAQTYLLHVVICGLLGFLVFTQPGEHLTATHYYLLKGGLYLALLGLFYVNVGWAVPHLLYRRRMLPYAGFVVVVVLGISLAHERVQQQLQQPDNASRSPPFSRASPGPGPGPNAGRSFPPPNGAGPVRQRWLNPAVLLATMLVLGLGTSVAAVQRGQREATARQALEQEKLQTELSWLKAQINPHFFFNTLNNIYSLTLLDGKEGARALHQLSRMMRYVLYETQTATTSLRQEIQFLQDYIELMQLRLTDNVAVQFETPEPLHEAAIAPMLLLTFVENAFKHGVSDLAPSHVRVVLRQPTPQTLELTVRNTIFPDRPGALDETSGIGLPNTRRRLELLYPNRHTLTITPLTPEHDYLVHLVLTL